MSVEVYREDGCWFAWISGLPGYDRPPVCTDTDEAGIIGLVQSVVQKRIKADVVLDWKGTGDAGKRLVRKLTKETSK